jgi:uncharacterized membrane protein YkgB
VNFLVRTLIRSGILNEDLDYHAIRASMVIIFLFFGYQKWFEYEAKVLIPYIGNGPLIFWLYPAFGVRGKPFFAGPRPPLHLVASDRIGEDVIRLTYVPA